MEKRLSLELARKKIVKHVSGTATETVPLMDALGRISAKSYYAPQALPDYSQSLFDGYAIAFQHLNQSQSSIDYTLAGEVAAGDTTVRRITAGKAYRIMTGAMVPRGTWKVVPQEKCIEKGDVVTVKSSDIRRLGTTIRRKGTNLRKGSIIIRGGFSLSSSYLAKLAQFGVDNIEVFRRAKVAFFCTGSELIDVTTEKKQGKKFSSNRYLLSGLVQQCDGEVYDGGIVKDDNKIIERQLIQLAEKNPVIIISTGGMGPGKYDLLEESFRRVGGETIFSSLQMRPGKSILFGLLGQSLYFGLPGPPFAVQTLFYALVLPTILAAQGHVRWKPLMRRARLDEEIHLSGSDMLRLQEGILFAQNEINMVRAARKNEQPNCYIYCHTGRKIFQRGMLVSVQIIP